MSFMKTNSVKIIDEKGVEYDSLVDLGLAIENTDYIGDAVIEDNMVFVPGSNKPIDYTEIVFGEQYYLYRPIEIIFGGMEAPELWDKKISRIRNLFHGKRLKIEFKTLEGWYFEGVARIQDFGRKRPLGKFTLSIPYADPYMYKKDVTEYTLTATTAGTTLEIENDEMPVIPDIETDNTVEVEYEGKSYVLADSGSHVIAELQLKSGKNVMKFKGNSVETVIRFREGRL